ncbi:polysaccharide pyruvyl transferase family protein [Janibacter sp. G368]|uniref:polysaccharide pyruvyl transferase family protein n=1 Tax=Janibacter sp. G368 TaxID=3420441 RepID=UPI003D00CE39
MRILLAGETFSPNLGDGLLFESLRQQVVALGCQVQAFDLSGRSGYERVSGPVPEEISVRRSFKHSALQRSGLVRQAASLGQWQRVRYEWSELAGKALSDCDAVLIHGGQLISGYNLTFALRLRELIHMAQRQGKRVALVGLGSDRELPTTVRKLFAPSFESSAYISVRDLSSAAEIRSVARQQVHVTPDLIFGMSIHEGAPLEGVLQNTAGINVQARSIFTRWSSYDVDSLYSLFHIWARDEFAQKNSVAFGNGDPMDAREVESLARVGSIDLAPRPSSPQELLHVVRRLDSCIAMRMHAGLASAAAGASVLSVAWDPKVAGVWELALSSVGRDARATPIVSLQRLLTLSGHDIEGMSTRFTPDELGELASLVRTGVATAVDSLS